MMSKEKRRVPKLRFPGFTEDWEQRKLSDILVERNEQQVETNEYPLMSFVQGHGVIPKGERYDRSFLVLDQSKKYKRTELGDFIYSSNNLETGSIGINKTGKAVISPVYSIFYGVSIGDSQFIGIMSLLPRFITKMIRFRQGVVYGQWRIHEKDFLDISILIPSEAERTKITKLILSIEELITLHQRKLDNLKLKKKALLQKLFPKNGERYPELRFPGFTDAWEQCKLSDLTQLITKGTTPKVKNIQNGVNFIKVENISDDGVISINSYVSEEEHMNFLSRSILSNNDILFSIAGTLGRTAIVKSHLLPANTNQALAIIRLNKSVDVVYINTFLKSNAIKTYIRKNPTVGAQPNLSLGQVSDLEINIPSYNEQKKISNLFSKFDLMITLHQ